MADAHAIEALVLVRWVLGGRETRSGDHRRQLGTAPSQERAQHGQLARRHAPPRPHAREPRQPAAAVEPHHQRFRLVIELVPGGESRKAAATAPVRKGGVSRAPCPILEIARRYRNRQRLMGDEQVRTQGGDHGGLVRACGAKPMIDTRGFDPARKRRGGEQEQRQTVRPARHRQTQARAAALPFRPKPEKIRGEARGQCGIGCPVNYSSLNRTWPCRGSRHIAP